MLGTGKVVRGIQGRLQHAGSAAGITRRAGNRTAMKRPSAASLLLLRRAASTASTGSTTNRAGHSATRPVVRGVVNGKAVPLAEDIVHERFLACIDRGDANAAMAHFVFISCDLKEKWYGEEHAASLGGAAEAGKLLTLRRRQLLVLLCEKGMVKEASEILDSAIASPAFNSGDSSTIASFMYVICGCLSHGDVDRALRHFHQASGMAIGLALPVCESLATALFMKGLQGEGTEGEAWNVLEYVRQRGMVHRPEVCERALLFALASRDLSFALRICRHVDDEGLALDQDVRDALFRRVGSAIKQLPDTAAFSVADVASASLADAKEEEGGGVCSIEGGGDGGGEWRVEGTNATIEELWELDALLQGWLDTEMDEFDEDDDEEDDGCDEDAEEIGETTEFDFSGEGSNEEEASGDSELDCHGDDMDMDIDNMTVDEMRNYWAKDVVDFNYEEGDDEDDDDDNGAGVGGESGGGAKTAAAPEGAPQAWSKETTHEGGDGEGRQSGRSYSAPDFAGNEFCGDLVDQMSELYPDREELAFKVDGEDCDFPGDGGFRRGGRAAGQYHSKPSRRSVYADLVMPYGDPHGAGGQGILSIPVKISVEESDDDDDEDD